MLIPKVTRVPQKNQFAFHEANFVQCFPGFLIKAVLLLFGKPVYGLRLMALLAARDSANLAPP